MRSQDQESLDNCTILFPIYKDGAYVAAAINHFRKLGFRNILVIDDDSPDQTCEIALNENVQFIRNRKQLGYELTLLKGLYNIKTDSVLVINDLENSIRSEEYDDFVTFGILGNYAMLLQRAHSAHSKKISDTMRKRFGVFVEDPSFNIIFMNDTMLRKIQRECPNGSTYLIYEFFRLLLNYKLKIGTYPLNVPEYEAATFYEKYRVKKRDRSQKYSYRNFLKYAFPDMPSIQFRRDLVIVVVTSITTLLTVVIPFLIGSMQ